MPGWAGDEGRATLVNADSDAKTGRLGGDAGAAASAATLSRPAARSRTAWASACR